MPKSRTNKKKDLWPGSGVIYIEAVVVIFITMFSLFLQYGSIKITALLSNHALITLIASLCVWFVNRFTLEYILQSRIESNKITLYLPFELLAASSIVTSIIYAITYLIVINLEEVSFVLADFLKGFLLTIGLSLLIVMIYLGSQVWKSWWSDGEFLLRIKDNGHDEIESKDFITIKNSRGAVNFNLHDVRYFISEYKIVFLVDSSGKKWITQYNLSELEKLLHNSFFRLNRKILVSRQIISHIKKLPNHRLLVTIGQSNESHKEPISRYRSTKFKHWFYGASP
jgi:hypothetical protein